MARPILEEFPVEIWERILSYATASSLLPFTESGEVASGLIDTLDLFLARCRSIKRYRKGTQATVERLRLVCRAWAKLLRPVASDYAQVDLRLKYCPSERMAKCATRLHLGVFVGCQCPYNERGKCTVPKQLMGSSLDEHRLLQFFNPRLKILFWHPHYMEKLEIPMNSIGNVLALSFYADVMPSWWSFNALTLAAPRLSHLHFLITTENSYILSEVVESPSLKYICLRLVLQGENESPAFIGWSFPRFRTLVMSGTLPIEKRVGLQAFLFRHRNTVAEIDIDNFSYVTPSYQHFASQTDPPLWEICPNITTLGIGRSSLAVTGDCLVKWSKASNMPAPGLTLLIHADDDYWAWENGLHDLNSLIAIKRAWDLKRVVYATSWEEQKMMEPRSKDRNWNARVLKSRLKASSRIFKELNLPIVDRYDIPLIDVVDRFLSFPETSELGPISSSDEDE